MAEPTLTQSVRFGVYEADLRSGELRRNGLKLKLSGQPFQVLALLLERAGDVVTREEIQKRLWPADTFVDFDHGLNTAINKIREALGDAADSPRFVETLPRRGYRFIAAVEGIATGTVAAMDKKRADPGTPLERSQEAFLSGKKESPPTVRKPGARLWLMLAATLAILILGTAGALDLWRRIQVRPELVQRQLTANSSGLAVLASAISPDGKYLVYSDETGIHLRVVNTSETHDLASPRGFRVTRLEGWSTINPRVEFGLYIYLRSTAQRTLSLFTMGPAQLISGGSLWEIRADVRTGRSRGEPRRIASWPDVETSGLTATAGWQAADVREASMGAVQH